MEEELHRRALALATLAHEIKNPLAIISGYVEMLLSKKVGSLTGRQEKILGETRSNCERLQKFAQEFLAYSALTFKNASAGLRLESWDLTVCLSEVCGFWLDKFSAKGVALYFRANPDVPPCGYVYVGTWLPVTSSVAASTGPATSACASSGNPVPFNLARASRNSAASTH